MFAKMAYSLISASWGRQLRRSNIMDALISGIIGAVIALVIALALVPTVISSTNDAAVNASGATKTLLQLVPLVFVAGLILVVVFLFMTKK
jgi:hypothetical protein